jgi:hypothetical protein
MRVLWQEGSPGPSRRLSNVDTNAICSGAGDCAEKLNGIEVEIKKSTAGRRSIVQVGDIGILVKS